MRDMIKDKALILAIVFLSSLALSIPIFAPSVRAQTPGVVCLAQPPASSCASSAPVIPGSVGSQLRVAVFIQNSAPLNRFDITVLADHTILQPSGVDLTGTVLLSPNILSECIGGVQRVSSSGCPTTATADTIELLAESCVGCGLTSSPTTGLLFTAIYNVVGSTASTPIGFQTGCSPSSVSGTTTCVTVANGGVPPVPETVHTATFTASSEFTLSASPTTLTIPKGSSATSTITVSGLSGFTGTVNLSANVAPAVHHSPTATLNPSSVTLTSNPASSILTVSTKATPIGTYIVTVTGTSGTQVAAVQITVNVTR